MTLSAYDGLVSRDRREDRQNDCRQLGIDGATKLLCLWWLRDPIPRR
jgi:hypothetical protein